MDGEKTIEKKKYINVLWFVYIGGSIAMTVFSVIASLSPWVYIYIIFNMFFAGWYTYRMKCSRDELQQSVKEAQNADRSKSDFLANMSHEIRTPINAIVGMCELVLRENDINESVRENCVNIQTSSRSLLAIINDILDFSKIESGKMELVEDEFNIASTINDVINMAVARKGDHDIEIIVMAEPDIPHGLIGDEGRIKQVIVNLVTNAVKFTHKGAVIISVTHTVQSYGINLNVSVKDSGIGITPENLEKLFASFQQVDTKKNRSVEGTGLGLAISKRLVTQMGGFINVSSEYGKGSEFKFVIPLKVSDTKPFITVKNAENIHAVGYFNLRKFTHPSIISGYKKLISTIGDQLHVDFKCFSEFPQLSNEIAEKGATHCFVGKEEYLEEKPYFDKMAENLELTIVQDRINSVPIKENIRCIYKPFYTISAATILNNEPLSSYISDNKNQIVRFVAPKARVLVVDDNVLNLKVAVGLMRPYHMQIMTAESAAAALSLLRSKDIDLVFMDHMMPEMDGVEATRIIRSMEGDYYQKLPIIALTANAVGGAREMFLNSGFSDFMAKPIELSVLDRILRNWLPAELKKNAADEALEEEKSRSLNPSGIENGWIDPEKGLFYTGGDADAYLDILGIYVKKGDEKADYIEQLFEKRDWKNYVIEVHALKSTSMTIGASRLSEMAKKVELAGKSGDYDTVIKNNEVLLKSYREVVTEGRKYLLKQEIKNDSAPGSDEQISFNELNLISKEEFKKILSELLSACEDYDGDRIEEIIDCSSGYAYKDISCSQLFAEVKVQTQDFEYDRAADIVKQMMDGLEE